MSGNSVSQQLRRYNVVRDPKKNSYQETIGVVIFLDFHSTKQGLPLVDSWSRDLD